MIFLCYRSGRLEQIACEGAICKVVELTEVDDMSKLPPDTIVTGTPKTSMRDAMEITYRSDYPVPVLSDDKRLVGVVGKNEILGGIIRDEES